MSTFWNISTLLSRSLALLLRKKLLAENPLWTKQLDCLAAYALERTTGGGRREI